MSKDKEKNKNKEEDNQIIKRNKSLIIRLTRKKIA